MKKQTERHIVKIFKKKNDNAVILPKEYQLQEPTTALPLEQRVVSKPINKSWQYIYNSMLGLSEKDFSLISKAISEDFPPKKIENKKTT